MRIAVILFNLGGPDSPAAVRPFLQNLFSDRAIIDLPDAARIPLAWFISRRRAKVAAHIYDRIGGRSPILPQTEAQAAALDAELARTLPGHDVRSFVCMRYWHPMSAEVMRDVATWKADRVVLLPLYPQLSTTTTESSIRDWLKTARTMHLDVPTRAVCCYATQPGFVAAASHLIRPAYLAASSRRPTRLLFSAHGLPEKIVQRGDPYPWHACRSAEAIVASLGIGELDWALCYQSRVGPLKWIGPSTDLEIERAGRTGHGIVLFPVSFVSEHSETLVELDIEYAELARKHGVPSYDRVPTVGIHPEFIGGLASLVADALAAPARPVINDHSIDHCDTAHGRCPLLSVDAFAIRAQGLAP